MSAQRRLAVGLALASAVATGAALAFVTPAQRGFVDRFETLSSQLQSAVGEALPESRAVGTAFLSGTYDPNLVVTEDANVSVTFVHEGAGYKNSLGYFTYRTIGGKVFIESSQLVLPNASHSNPNIGWGGGLMVPGDTSTLRDADGNVRVFQSGERIGFFLVANGWDGQKVRGWAGPLSLPKSTSALNASAGVFTTLDELNPENSVGRSDKARHVALLSVAPSPDLLQGRPFLLLGFEDLRRDGNSDEDFNDLVLLVHANPPEAIADTDVPTYSVDLRDPDGDGVEGLDDYFPYDPDRAFITRNPATSWQTIAFEDNYPALGDRDYNDAVIQFAYEEVLTASGQLKDLIGTFHLIARGATYDHRFGVMLHGLPANVAGTLSYEWFSPADVRSSAGPIPIASVRELEAGGARLRIGDVFSSTLRALPGPDQAAFANTSSAQPESPPASARFVLRFDVPLSRSVLEPFPYDPYLSVVHGQEAWDVHLPGKTGLEGRPPALPGEFVDADGYPWALLVPADWRYPLERVRINGAGAAYPAFDPWRVSRGSQQTGWYRSPSTSANPVRVCAPIAESTRARPWRLDASKVQ